MPRYPLAGGIGDMVKDVYDPDDDGFIDSFITDKRLYVIAEGAEEAFNISDLNIMDLATEYTFDPVGEGFELMPTVPTYTLDKANHRDNAKKIKVTLAGEICHGDTGASSRTCYLGYTKNSVDVGDVVEIGSRAHSGACSYGSVSLVEQELADGDIIRWWCKCVVCGNVKVKNRTIVHTHTIVKPTTIGHFER